MVRQKDSAARRAIFFLSLKTDVRLKQGDYDTIHTSSTEPVYTCFPESKKLFSTETKKNLLKQKEHETIYTFSTKPIRKHFQLRQRKLFLS